MAQTDKEILGNLLTAYVSNNQVSLDDFKEMLALVTGAQTPVAAATPAPTISAPVDEKPPVRQPEKPDREPKSEQEIAESVGQHHIVSFIDGRPYKTLRRHIGAHGYNDHTYKQYFGLPADYPMVAPSYSESRSQMSKDLGLGRKPRERGSETVSVRSSESVKEARQREQGEAAEKERVAAEDKEKARQKSQAKAKAAKDAKAKGDSEQPDV